MYDDGRHPERSRVSFPAAALFAVVVTAIAVLPLRAQEEDSFRISNYVVFDTTVTITASRLLNIDDFIRMVRSDESLYRAFRNLRFASFRFDTRMKMYRKNGKERASYESTASQWSDGRCRSMTLISEESDGNFWKKKKIRKHRYYTARLFENLFYTRDTICEDPKAKRDPDPGGLLGIENYIENLKTLVFSPGSPSGLPMIGDKTAIFEEHMAPYYDYTFRSTGLDERFPDCYEFRAEAKDRYKNSGRTIIRLFSTFFDKESFQVVGRSYKLGDETKLYDFDVEMIIYIRSVGDKYYPSQLFYKGYWNIPGRYPEIGGFQTRFYDFEIPGQNDLK